MEPLESKIDFRKVNRDKLVAFFKSGEKFSQNMGFELEHIVVRRDGSPVSYSEPGGIRDVLSRMAPQYDHVSYEGDNIVGLQRAGVAISTEPAGQIEISAGPFSHVTEIDRAYLDFRNDLDPILKEFGLVTPMLGYHPTARARDLELIPKFRYSCMTDFLGKQSPDAICMMRGSSSLQISIDFESEGDAMRKLRLAEIISPILALICDNSPVYEGQEAKGNMARTRMWGSMKEDRVGVIPGSLKRGYSFGDYADYILSRQAILAPGETEGEPWRYVGETTFDELYADREMTDAEMEHALSMVWPDVRLKNFVEIRPADAMPIEYALAYAVLVRSLFYSRRTLDVLDALFESVDEGHVAAAKRDLIEFGYGAEIYGRSAEYWADLLLVLASGTLRPGEAEYLEPIASMVKHRFTLAEVWPRLMEKRNGMPAGSPNAPVIGVVPRYDFEWTGLAVSDGYLSGLLEMGAIPIVLPATADPANIARLVDSCDGFLIPGGQDIDPARYGRRREVHTHRSATARDAMEDALVRAIIAADKPLLGICRGMQSINVALGGTLRQDVRDESARCEPSHVQHRPYTLPAHMVELAEDSQLAEYVGATRLGVNTIHHQSVDEVGEGLVVNAVSPEDGIVEGIEMPGKRFVVGVQWHPEHMWRERPHSKRLFKAFVDAAAEVRAERG